MKVSTRCHCVNMKLRKTLGIPPTCARTYNVWRSYCNLYCVVVVFLVHVHTHIHFVQVVQQLQSTNTSKQKLRNTTSSARMHLTTKLPSIPKVTLHLPTTNKTTADYMPQLDYISLADEEHSISLQWLTPSLISAIKTISSTTDTWLPWHREELHSKRESNDADSTITSFFVINKCMQHSLDYLSTDRKTIMTLLLLLHSLEPN